MHFPLSLLESGSHFRFKIHARNYPPETRKSGIQIAEFKRTKKSVLLIGPRQTGKSTFMLSLKPDLEINLAHEQTFLEFAQNPLELESRIQGKRKIFIDEIQKLPRMTNTIQTLIDKNKSLQFLLTGSSARKLRRGRANLLPGRVLSYLMGHIAAQAGQVLDISKITAKALITRPSAGRFFEILEDTLVVRRCPAFSHGERQRLIQHPKFYFFDCGVWNGLLKNFETSLDRMGALFETFIFNQICDALNAKGEIYRISFYRTEHGAEVDFILEKEGKVFAIEVKATQNIGPHDLKGFQSFANFHKKKFSSILIYLGKSEKSVSGIAILPWERALDLLV